MSRKQLSAVDYCDLFKSRQYTVLGLEEFIPCNEHRRRKFIIFKPFSATSRPAIIAEREKDYKVLLLISLFFG